MAIVPGALLPGGMLPPPPKGAPLPVPVLDTLDSKMAGLESKQIARRVHLNCSTRGISQDHRKQCVRRLLALLVVLWCSMDTNRNGMLVHVGHTVRGVRGFIRGNLLCTSSHGGIAAWLGEAHMRPSCASHRLAST